MPGRRSSADTEVPPPGPDLSRSRRVTGSAPPRRGDAATGRAPMPGPPGAASGLDAARSDRPPSASPDAPCESAASGRPVDAPRRGADRRVHMQHKLSLAKRQASLQLLPTAHTPSASSKTKSSQVTRKALSWNVVPSVTPCPLSGCRPVDSLRTARRQSYKDVLVRGEAARTGRLCKTRKGR